MVHSTGARRPTPLSALTLVAAVVLSPSALPRVARAGAAATPVATPTHQAPPTRTAYLSPAGILPDRSLTFLLKADTELTFYPAVFAGFRVGVGDRVDVGLEAGGIDKVVLVRGHLKTKVWEPASRNWFAGFRLRIDYKRHVQDFGPNAPPIDDHGFGIAPEATFARRFGERGQHAVYYAGLFYFDVDIRDGFGAQYYAMPVMLGYEWVADFGMHLQVDAGMVFEVDNEEFGFQPFPKMRVVVGWDFELAPG